MLQDPAMSMLAEPRRRQKWSVDPRNSAWSKDESKFGQKMLERMGWSKGKGLGRSEQGATDHIKVKVKNNSLGLGAAVYNEDNWIAHQDDFNQLLADLNNCHSQNSTEEATQEQKQGFSLEEKSKTSRKRVHYMKFTKGKDLSNRSEKDLACIFGKRSKKTRDQDEESSGPESQGEKEEKEEMEQNSENDKDQPTNSELELNTVTSTLTMQEYFAQRMAQLKKGLSASSSPAASGNPQSPSTSIEESPNTSDMEQSRKKKKKKKRKDDQQEDEEKVEEAEEPQLKEEVVDTEPDLSERKKKKKRKREAKEEDTAEEYSVSTAKDDSTGDVAAIAIKKKKKNKQKNKEDPTQTHTETLNEHDSTEKVMGIKLSDKKKKRKHREHLEQLDEQPAVVVEGKKPKKDKKKKKTDN